MKKILEERRREKEEDKLAKYVAIGKCYNYFILH